MSVAKQYIEGLKKAYLEVNSKMPPSDEGDNVCYYWEAFEEVAHGASAEDISKLKEKFPDCPTALIELLEFADGTYYRQYGDKEAIFYFFGSTLEEGEYPYYLLSAEQMLSDFDNANLDVGDDDYFDDENFDPKIRRDAHNSKWLLFSDCMNNGGTSNLYIDFTPSEKGVVGQVVMFVHDPDEYKVIADSFEEYLQMIIDDNFPFVCLDNLDLEE